MHKAIKLIGAVLMLVSAVNSLGAGRAFPVQSENYAIESFRKVNPSIDWDPTNFLVDRAGEFAICGERIRKGYDNTNVQSPRGGGVGLVIDYMDGPYTDAMSVHGYIVHTLDQWMASNLYRTMITHARFFGCSVRPGCSFVEDRFNRRTTVAVVACLFNPRMPLSVDDRVPDTREPTRRPRPRRPRRNRQPTPIQEPIPRPAVYPADGDLKQRGLAFTAEQYAVAEGITGNDWDRSHFLENLSGYEASCSMVGDQDWEYRQANDMAQRHFQGILGVKGEALNRGITQHAMEEILKEFTEIRSASRVGCSLIPDCTRQRGRRPEMWVVVVCIYQKPTRGGWYHLTQ